MVQVSTTAPSERYPGRPPEGRIIVIAPTRASCETIELGVQLEGVETILQQQHGEELRRLAAERKGFGIVAGTGTGKTLAIRPIAQEIVGPELRVGVVNREREATPETPSWTVVIVTTGIARRWLQDGLISGEDTVVVDEIHQTSAELELCLALAKREGCTFIWLSATVDPTFYAEYLNSATVIESSAFDPARAATVRVSNTLNPLDFLADRFLRHVAKGNRGVAVFVPTRAGTEAVAKRVGEQAPKLSTEFYHGGEPVAKLAPFLTGEAPKPYVLAMTAAGQSALNIRGLDTVVIEDAQFTTLVKRGKSVLTRLPLGANEILQMAGRVHGRVEGGEVYILSERNIDFASLQPTEPNFQLAGDPERVAMTCADMGVRADDLELPVPLDRMAYRRAVELLERRGIIRDNRLTEYGRKVEVLPVDRPLGELLVQSPDHLVPVVATSAAIESLYRMLRQDNDIGAYTVPGSDHLTTYRIYEDALRSCGSLGYVYGLSRHVFDEQALADWAEERGVMVRSIEDAALAIASIYRSLDLDLPRHFPRLNDSLIRDWQRLLAKVMPFDLVIDQETSWGEEVRVSPSSMCGGYGAVAGTIRYFAGPGGRTRGSIEGTEIPYNLLWEFSEPAEPEVLYDPAHRRGPLRVRRVRVYHGFELDSEVESIDEFPADLADECRRVLAEAVATGAAYHPDTKVNREIIRELREVYRRSGGAFPEPSEKRLTEYLVERMARVSSFEEFHEAELRVNPDDFVPREERERWLALPDTIELNGEEYPLDYAVEGEQAVVRARIPVKLLNRIDEEDVPTLDRPLYWTVMRGKREAIRARSLDEARELVDASLAVHREEWLEQELWEETGGNAQPRRRGQQGKQHGNQP
ncbi:MAG: DEAD/DEAH box helicase, partial [Gemmatimonadota bacterium]|nr:DEAD/DEAH box helicase [Gemmatimonadota bacterium]